MGVSLEKNFSWFPLGGDFVTGTFPTNYQMRFCWAVGPSGSFVQRTPVKL